MAGKKINDTVIIVIIVAGFFLFLTSLLHQNNFVDRWFADARAATLFEILFCIWILAEIVNNLWSKKNTVPTTQDRSSYGVVTVTLFGGLFIIAACRSFQIGVLSGLLQYAGLIVIAGGILLREWAVLVLGKHFTVRVQTDNTYAMVTSGPYHYIRHPSYTGSLLALTGIALAVGTWFGAILVILISLIAYEYRIRVEEAALLRTFGPEYEHYKARTGKLLPKL